MIEAPLEIPALIAWMLTALGALAAGLGIFRAGASASRVALQFAHFAAALINAENRQAAALERSADLVPLLEQMHAEREQMSRTLRIISRDLTALKKVNGLDEIEESVA